MLRMPRDLVRGKDVGSHLRCQGLRQAFLLYQHLAGRAWIESEELSVDDLSGPEGLQIFRGWIQERYQEVSKIAESVLSSVVFGGSPIRR